jgi:hypothetical protein
MHRVQTVDRWSAGASNQFDKQAEFIIGLLHAAAMNRSNVESPKDVVIEIAPRRDVGEPL